MKTIAVRVSGALSEHQLLDDASYVESYEDLGRELERRGARLYLVKENTFYRGGNAFDRGWVFGDGRFHFTQEPFEADLIFNKDSAFEPRDGARMINRKDFDIFCNNKWSVYSLFPSLFPQTIRLSSKEEAAAALQKLQGDYAVIKPLASYGGEGVFIGARQEVLHHLTHFPYLAQEFIDSSKGIPGVTDTLHDFRLIIINGNVIHTFIRTPRTETFVANVARGGILMPVPKRMRPPEALALVEPIDAQLAQYGPRMYSIDCARHADGRWLLLELNAPPGQQSRRECGDEAGEYFDALCGLLLENA
jgi:glutathione synthase/RimK-type ligase-like ATP-grasp enzyme